MIRKIHLRHESNVPSMTTEIGMENIKDPGHTAFLDNEGTRHTDATRNRLIMIIDDSPTVRKIIEVSLGREGFEVISFPDGIEALQAITKRHLHRIPDLVILDTDLPKMNGYEVARYLRSKPQWSRMVIVILSRHDGVLDRLKARLAGTQAYLTKPFTTEMIVNVVSTKLGLSSPLIKEVEGTRERAL